MSNNNNNPNGGGMFIGNRMPGFNSFINNNPPPNCSPHQSPRRHPMQQANGPIWIDKVCPFIIYISTAVQGPVAFQWQKWNVLTSSSFAVCSLWFNKHRNSPFQVLTNCPLLEQLSSKLLFWLTHQSLVIMLGMVLTTIWAIERVYLFERSKFYESVH